MCIGGGVGGVGGGTVIRTEIEIYIFSFVKYTVDFSTDSLLKRCFFKTLFCICTYVYNRTLRHVDWPC